MATKKNTTSSCEKNIRVINPVSNPVAMKEYTLSMPDWSLLPEELLHLISTHLKDCFHVVHARSVCSSWRSTFPFPSCLLRPSYSLPRFKEHSLESEGFFTLEKIPLFLFRVCSPSAAVEPASEYFLGGIGRRDEAEDHMELSSHIQCSVKVKMGESEPTLMNMLDCQILPIGHQYRMIGWNPGNWRKDYIGVAFLPLNKDGREGGGEFVVLIGYSDDLLVLRSAEMRWMRLKKLSVSPMKDLATFRGKFYAISEKEDIFVIDPYSLETTTLLSVPPMEFHTFDSYEYLVPSGNDELFLVKVIYLTLVSRRFSIEKALRVSRLDEEAGKWVEVTDLGDRVLFINEQHLGNLCCSAKELPDGCGMTGNSILFTNHGNLLL